MLFSSIIRKIVCCWCAPIAPFLSLMSVIMLSDIICENVILLSTIYYVQSIRYNFNYDLLTT